MFLRMDMDLSTGAVPISAEGNTKPGVCTQACRFNGLSWLRNHWLRTKPYELDAYLQASHAPSIAWYLLSPGLGEHRKQMRNT